MATSRSLTVYTCRYIDSSTLHMRLLQHTQVFTKSLAYFF
uniref:Uncharacterized protein n=1 Tax=Anguilla anguilla TaxID=7936 RepID=A0A0E9P7C3_ANGAN